MHFACSSGVPYTSMQRILMPLSRETWSFTVASMLLFLIWMCLNKKVRSARGNVTLPKIEYIVSAYDMVKTFLGLPLSERTLQENATTSLIIWLMAIFVLRNAYLGSLFDLLAGQVNEDPVDTLEKIYKHNYTIYCTMPSSCEILNKTMPHLRPQ